MANRILIVDSEKAVREIIVSMLTSAGYQCCGAGTGVEALAVLDSGKEFELILSCLMMPDIDGLGLLERVKNKYPDTPVVIVTAVHDISVALGAIRNGAWDYVLKPFEREQLLNTVSRALQNRRLKMENRNYQENLESLVESRTKQWQAALEDLKRSYDITLEVLGEVLDYKDQETLLHTKRVTAYTMAIARRMGIPGEQIETIARGAFLHDIGKVAIADHILNKPGKLTPDEVATMRQHCYLGYKLVLKVPVPREAAEIVYSHHEHFGGTGYSRGLKGQEIPLGARIIAVANTLDSITSDLPYRPKQSYQAGREEVVRCSGTQFDPEVVNVFLQIPEKVWEDLRRMLARGPSGKTDD